MKKLKIPQMPVIACIALLAMLLSLACAFSANVDKEGATVKLELKETDLNRLFDESASTIDDDDVLLKDVTEVELQEDLIRVFGTYEKPDGTTAEGSYDLTMAAEDGRLVVEIVGVDMEGVEIGDERITRLNEELEEKLAKSAAQSEGELEFTSVDVTEEAVKISVRVLFNNNK